MIGFVHGHKSDLFLWSVTFVHFPENAGNCGLSVTWTRESPFQGEKLLWVECCLLCSFVICRCLTGNEHGCGRTASWKMSQSITERTFKKQGSCLSCSIVLSSLYLLLSIKLKNRTLFSFLLLCVLVTALSLLQHESGD